MEEYGKHVLSIEGRKILKLEGVQHVGSFDEHEITLDTNMGFLQLKGEGMHITHLNLDQGSLVVEGFIHGLEYLEGRTAKGSKARSKGFIHRLLK
ncbi:sporulation protein YabP [Desulforamulus hydrothermalis]|uniref:Sporulation protein YabP n=1 Tax=Desulforamulus hydrothermalis Lam5 = DSM 18033 TaxID=1121428 RepID=K8EJ54_9FIRM|nr:sporulation protein YabP [Desulforamulus hydrothermalis]CCO08631.1 Sporulation protein YabP [Desulforamulus hydrothermalis Lam5 = DSM 18033]SHH00771.1 sporulation protein YabP [Desulforamulus hydrothermalis Lam5 = DSM 18033]